MLIAFELGRFRRVNFNNFELAAHCRNDCAGSVIIDRAKRIAQ
jgi:hypothetical protein